MKKSRQRYSYSYDDDDEDGGGDFYEWYTRNMGDETERSYTLQKIETILLNMFGSCSANVQNLMDAATSRQPSDVMRVGTDNSDSTESECSQEMNRARAMRRRRAKSATPQRAKSATPQRRVRSSSRRCRSARPSRSTSRMSRKRISASPPPSSRFANPIISLDHAACDDMSAISAGTLDELAAKHTRMLMLQKIRAEREQKVEEDSMSYLSKSSSDTTEFQSVWERPSSAHNNFYHNDSLDNQLAMKGRRLGWEDPSTRRLRREKQRAGFDTIEEKIDDTVDLRPDESEI